MCYQNIVHNLVGLLDIIQVRLSPTNSKKLRKINYVVLNKIIDPVIQYYLN
jgi:hypothetical protein